MITTYTNVLLLHYNNYFNRIVKKEASVLDYMNADTTNPGTAQAVHHYADCSNINFNPSDGINTSLILGYSTNPTIKDDYDYCVVYKYEDDDEQHTITRTVISRWFVMDFSRTREGQYEFSLKRDVIVDNYSKVTSAPCFIEKATITDIQNPFLYNNENFEVNQIKTSETLIKDASGIGWVVGYVSSKLSTETKNVEVTTIALDSNGAASGSTVYTTSTSFVKIFIQYNGQNIYGGETGFSYTFNVSTGVLTYSINVAAWASKTVSLRVLYTGTSTISSKNYKTTLPADESRLHLTDAPYDMFCIPYGQILLRTANINTTKEAALEIAFEISKDLGKEALYDIQLLPYCPKRDMLVSGQIAEILGTLNVDYNYIYNNSNVIKSIMLWCAKSNDSFTASPESEINVSRPLTSTTSTGSLTGTGVLSRTSSSNTNASFRIENDIFKTRIIQSLTSLTATKYIATDTITTFTSFTQNMDTGVVIIQYTGTNFPVGTQSDVSFTLSYTYKEFENPLYVDYKISNECDLYRLTSPNYNGQFEWSLAKSNGSANYFDVDFTYKPFQPYIHLAPTFTKLYGQDFDDVRGLICGGDFSLPIITDAWTEYQVQNKTYQEMFDRQIQNIDTQNVVNSGQAAIQAVTGTINGAIGGGIAGGKLGGGYGAAAGAAIGGTASLLGGIADYNNLLTMQQENRSYAIDMYNYGLKNVQALPYGLTKVSAYNKNNKLFPMVEYFTCTSQEKQAFKNKLKYNGMTVMIIDTLSNYISNSEKRFCKGQIVRLEDLGDDNHMAMEIYNEINKGVYI